MVLVDRGLTRIVDLEFVSRARAGGQLPGLVAEIGHAHAVLLSALPDVNAGSLPRNRSQQAVDNRQVQDRFASTCRLPAVPAPLSGDPIADPKELAPLHQSGVLTDAEYQAANSKLLAP